MARVVDFETVIEAVLAGAPPFMLMRVAPSPFAVWYGRAVRRAALSGDRSVIQDAIKEKSFFVAYAAIRAAGHVISRSNPDVTEREIGRSFIKALSCKDVTQMNRGHFYGWHRIKVLTFRPADDVVWRWQLNARCQVCQPNELALVEVEVFPEIQNLR